MNEAQAVEAKPKPVYTTRLNCRLCHSVEMDTVLNLGNFYLADFVARQDALSPSAPLVLVRCRKCSLIQLRDTVDRDMLYREYWYRSGINATMRAALRDVVLDAEAHAPIGGSNRWLDIGANDGTLLAHAAPGFTKIACEPARTFHDELRERCDVLIPDYFSADHDALRGANGGGCTVITSCAMFYDLDEPDEFVAAIAASLTDDGIWVNQLSDTRLMLRRNAFDNIVHEHLCYYDLQTLQALYARHGLKIVTWSYNEVNGGSLRVIAKRGEPNPIHAPEVITPNDVTDFVRRIERWRAFMTELLAMRTAVWAYGASTKGSTLLQYLKTDAFRIEGIADRNPAKWGLRMPGVWAPITNEDTMREAKPELLLVLPWAFRDEFVEREQPLRRAGTTMLFPLPNPELVL